MSDFNFKIGDRIRDPKWVASSFIEITAIGQRRFLGLRQDDAEHSFRFDHCEWMRFVENPVTNLIIEAKKILKKMKNTDENVFYSDVIREFEKAINTAMERV